ncbi:DNA topoisomerase 1B-like protein (plasmid) [Phaeobacter piscinae]|uniref:DNA topoisomerase n=1 Tax=Phaeobacter piscinae TaxID=1580596 RepID=A0ABN5DJG7_9RHOB|nr:DNA topoisomerase IB [Phaeobacter piscinae]ATG37610.1 DNA topoisomerase 1B-like protein [Phaeobacter piscinae]AUQ88131.1 DNA topoisomerase 1B-like protein [Phaeobacter piscinae]AUR26014.1 DNA topoisomerase 1B-like protein [Phaeobacter piscinae]
MKLVYYTDDQPGVTRRRRGRGFSYYMPDGSHIGDAAERARLNGLGVPPAYTDVWLCPLSNGHLQATGRDARDRKQYRYHPEWQAHRAEQKFAQLGTFGERLPVLRRWISDRLTGPVGDEETAIAAVLALLDRGSLRIGNPSYTEENGSYGATTLRPRHVAFSGQVIQLRYTAKGGQTVEKSLRGPALQRILERSQDLAGPELISWVDADGNARAVRSEQVQEVLAELCGDGVSAKTLRTWNGSHAAFTVALDAPTLTITAMAEAAAERLHNTPTIARNSYIHPQIIALAELPDSQRAARLSALPQRQVGGLRLGEGRLIDFLDAS